MGSSRFERSRIGGVLGATALAAVLCLAASPGLLAAGIDPDAEEILRETSKYMSKLQAFSVSAEIDTEVIDLEGQKLQVSSSGDLVLIRPGKFYSRRLAPKGAYEVFFDGKNVTLYGKAGERYFQVASPGTFEQAVGNLRAETGFEIPGADLLLADPYPGLMTDVKSGNYLGTSWVSGVQCHQVAMRAEKVDWQLWVQTGDKPLPMKYIITSKWLTGAPSFSVRFRDWNTQPKIAPSKFDFKAPAGAKRLESVKLNTLGEVEFDGEKQ
jgi:hypothetical protein